MFALLPGFLAAWVFYGLTAHRKKAPFERIVEALIFGLFVQGTTVIVEWCLRSSSKWYSFGEWTDRVAFVWSVVDAVLIGLLLAIFANTGWIHRVLQKLKITSRTSFPSEWFSVFHRDERYIVLHLAEGRRLYGWPWEWPDHPDSGHFVIDEPAWLLNDNTRVPLYTVDRMLIPATDVKMIEFIKDVAEVTANDQEIKDAESKLLNLYKEKKNGK